jgi:hypothetical protein
MKTAKATPLIGVVLGKTSTPAEASEIAHRFRKCPYCSSFQSTGNSAMGIFALPQGYEWWLNRLAGQSNGGLGFEDTEVIFTKAIEASSPWTRGDVKPNLHPAPCGTDCRQCSCYGNECNGCPATLEYKTG